MNEFVIGGSGDASTCGILCAWAGNKEGYVVSDCYSKGSIEGSTYLAGIIAETYANNTVRNCWRNPDMTLSYYAVSAYNELYDQNDTDADHPLYRKYSDKYYFPYNGKASGISEKITDVAKRIGWDENIWDLSGNEPMLKTSILQQ